MYGKTLHYKRHLVINIGEYFKVHGHEDTRNSKVTQTKVTICLGTSGNEQGGLRLMSLNPAKKSPEGVGTPY